MAEGRSSKSFVTQKGHQKADSGNCNVCSAPCSSCMHRSVGYMELKEESSGETSCQPLDSLVSVNKDDAFPSMGRVQDATSEVSNVATNESFHDSLFENAESSVSVKSDAVDKLDHAELVVKFPPNGIATKNKHLQVLTSLTEVNIPPHKGDGSKRNDGHKDNKLHVRFDGDEKKASGKNVYDCIPEASDSGCEGSCGSQQPKTSKSSEVCLDSPCENNANTSAKIEAGNNIRVSDMPDDVTKQLDQTGVAKKSLEMAQLNDPKELQTQDEMENENEDAELMEEDVKVCDICGDAGIEDLLAICSNCSDGAEHTYCMREKHDAIPEGEWLCEDCKFSEEVGKRKQGSGVEGKEIEPKSCVQRFGKRPLEDPEISPFPKRQVLETVVRSPKAVSPVRVAAASLEPSLNNLDKEKPKPSYSTLPINETTDVGRSTVIKPQMVKGTLLKSNSFNTLSSKPKVKLVDEVVLPKQKAAKERANIDKREGSLRTMSKSMSFKSGNFGRAVCRDPKLKPLSSRAHLHEPDGSKQLKERKVGASVMNELGISTERKPNQIKTDDGHLPTAPRMAERQCSNFTSLPLPRNQVEKPKESVAARSVDTSSTKNSREMNKDNRLRAAVEAAMRKKPCFGKGRGPDQSDGSCVSNAEPNCERLQSHILASNKNKDSVIIEGRTEGLINPQTNSVACKQGTGNNISSLRGESDVNIPPLKKSARDSVGPILPTSSVCAKAFAIPEQEYIWQGGFQVQKAGNCSEIHNGIQAHLSNLASPKVLEAVNKFSEKITLYESSRKSTWPTQFCKNGAKEDHIALYFFAKDVESYEQTYKTLVDKIIKNDLALKANFDGVELLIFASNQLQEECQRWNNLYFLWGVFRGRKVQFLSSKNQISTSTDAFYQDKRDPHSLLQTQSSAKLTEKEASACKGSAGTVASSVTLGSTVVIATGYQNNKVSPNEQTASQYGVCYNLQGSKFAQAAESRAASGQLYLEVESVSPLSQVGDQQLETVLDRRVPGCHEAIVRSSGLREPEKSCSLGEDEAAALKAAPVSSQGVGSIVGGREEKMLGCRDLTTLDVNAKGHDVASVRDGRIERFRTSLTNQQKLPETPIGMDAKTLADEGSSALLDAATLMKAFTMSSMDAHEFLSSANKINSLLSEKLKPGLSSYEKREKIFDGKPLTEDFGGARVFSRDSLENKDFRVAGHATASAKPFSPMEKQSSGILGTGLELGLGSERAPTDMGTLPLFSGGEDQRGAHLKPLKEKRKEEEEDLSSSLSLSLSFPFPEK